MKLEEGYLRVHPILYFIEDGMTVAYKYRGIENKKEDFVKLMEFVAGRHYQEMSWEEYSGQKKE